MFFANVNHSAPMTLVSSVRNASHSSRQVLQLSPNSTRWDVMWMRELPPVTKENVFVNLVPAISAVPGHNASTASNFRIRIAREQRLWSLTIQSAPVHAFQSLTKLPPVPMAQTENAIL
mmetsp:Transcript_9499/g.13855  ORF Transcript_9499/g.13855 Transcript_9499/m.13855 type:complete len:119 (-) Transcript_9499:235-591(-)